MPKTVPLTVPEEIARLSLLELMTIRGVRPAELARRTRSTPQRMSEKMNARSVLGINDLRLFADALDVDPAIFLFDPTVDDPDEFTFGLSPAEFALYAERLERAVLRSTSERGAAEVPLVVSLVGSALVAWAGVRTPALAMWIAENQREDRVMSSAHSTRSGPPAFCHSGVTIPTQSAIMLYRPHTYRHNKPECNLYRRRCRSAAFSVGAQ